MRMFWWIIVLGYLGSVSMGFAEFNIWDQVVVLWESEPQLEDLLMNPHGLRLMLVFPIFALNDKTGIPCNWIFSQVVAGVVIFMSILVERTIHMLQGGRKGLVTANIVTTFFVTTSLLMNGRIAFALLGMAIFLHTATAWEWSTLGLGNAVFRFISALFLASVSSGTFLVAIMALYSWLFYRLFRKVGKFRIMVSDVKLAVPFIILLFLLTPLLVVLVGKNVDFFGGGLSGVFGMLSHGTGKILYDADGLSIAFISIILLLVGFSLLVVMSVYRKIRLPVFTIVIGACGGLFGYSTLMMVVPPFVVLAALAVGHMAKSTNAYRITCEIAM